MGVDPNSSPAVEHQGRSYHFCSERCRATFQASPERYTSKESSGKSSGKSSGGSPGDSHLAPHRPAAGGDEPPSGSEVAEWTCPMHPEIRRPGPGSCPICGMAL